jgi:hypothetical protein
MLGGLFRIAFWLIVVQAAAFFGYRLYVALQEFGLPVRDAVELAADDTVALHQAEVATVRAWIEDVSPADVPGRGALADAARSAGERLAGLSRAEISGRRVLSGDAVGGVSPGAAGVLLVGVAVVIVGVVVVRAVANDPVRRNRRELTRRFRAIDREHLDMAEKAIEFNRLFTSYMKRR